MAIAIKKKEEQAYFNTLLEIMSENGKDNVFYDYKKKVIAAMLDMGADDCDFSLLTDEMVFNGLNNNWKPESLAWAILQ